MLKKIIIISFSFFFYFNLATSSDLKIVYIDINKIINESNAGKKITKELETLNNSNIKKFKNEEKKLADEEKKIVQQKNVLSNEEFQKKANILKKKIIGFKKDVNTSKRTIDNKRVKATTKILDVLNPILSEYSSKNSISLIIQKKNIVIGKSELDITNKILVLLNSKVKSVKIN